MKRRYIAFLAFALAACGGGNGTPADTGPVDSGLIMDTSVPDTSTPDSGPTDSGMDAGPTTPRSTTFATSSGGVEMTGGGFKLKLTVGITPAGHSTAPGTDLSLGANSNLR